MIMTVARIHPVYAPPADVKQRCPALSRVSKLSAHTVNMSLLQNPAAAGEPACLEDIRKQMRDEELSAFEREEMKSMQVMNGHATSSVAPEPKKLLEQKTNTAGCSPTAIL